MTAGISQELIAFTAGHAMILHKEKQNMELIDLFKGFDLNKLKDKDLKGVAAGIGYMLITEPVISKGIKDPSQAEALISEESMKWMKKIIGGNILDKAKMVAAVYKNMKKAPAGTDPVIVDVDVEPMIRTVENMHIHNMSDEDYHKIGDELARLAVRTGNFKDILSRPAVSETALTTDAASKIFTAMKIALQQKDVLIQQAEESKARAQKKAE